MWIAAAAMAVFVGFILGGLGGGGGILTLPTLIYVLEIEPRSAIAASMLIVGLGATSGVIQHARRGNVLWRTGVGFGLGAMAGSYGGARLAGYAPTSALLLIFAGLMVIAGVKLIVGRSGESDEASSAPAAPWRSSLWLVAAEGLVIGAITGLVGAGGGFIVVPVLVFVSGISMRKAIGTSLLVVAMKSVPGVIGHLSNAELPWIVAGLFAIFAIGGTFIGTSVSANLPQRTLRPAFGVLLLLAAATVTAKNLGVL